MATFVKLAFTFILRSSLTESALSVSVSGGKSKGTNGFSASKNILLKTWSRFLRAFYGS